jgi:hypothetical protein
MKHIKLFENWQEDEDMESGSTLEYTPSSDVNSVTPEEARSLIVRALNMKASGEDRVKPIMLVGAPGMGMSEVAMAAAEEAGVEPLVLDLPTMSPEDFEGGAYVRSTDVMSGTAERAIPSWFPTEGPGILVLNDLNRAENKIKYSAFALAQGGVMGGIRLPEGWLIVATASGVEGGISFGKFADRFTIINLKLG